MARVKKGVNAHKRHKKVLKQAKGYYGQRSKNFRAANPAVMRALRSAYIGRKLKKFQKALDRQNQCRRQTERNQLQQTDRRSEEERHRHQQKNAVRNRNQ